MHTFHCHEHCLWNCGYGSFSALFDTGQKGNVTSNASPCKFKNFTTKDLTTIRYQPKKREEIVISVSSNIRINRIGWNTSTENVRILHVTWTFRCFSEQKRIFPFFGAKMNPPSRMRDFSCTCLTYCISPFRWHATPLISYFLPLFVSASLCFRKLARIKLRTASGPLNVRFTPTLPRVLSLEPLRLDPRKEKEFRANELANTALVTLNNVYFSSRL